VRAVHERADPGADTPQRTSEFGPVRIGERIEILDVLRGWALFGVFLCNMRWFSGYGDVRDLWTGPADQLAILLVDYLADDKFYTLFSFLFGLGFALQIIRAQARNAPFVRVYARRLIVLFLIGLAHVCVWGWWGEALHIYAALGFALLLLRRAPNRVVLTLAALFLLVVPALYFSAEAVRELRPEDPETAAADTREMVRRNSEAWARGEAEVWHATRATVGEAAAYRARTWLPSGIAEHTLPYTYFAWYSPILGLFLLGLYVGRRGILQNASAHRKFIRRTQWWGLAIGLPGTLAALVLRQMGGPVSHPQLLANLIWIIAAPALTFFYAALIVLLWQSSHWRRLLAPLAAVGRTALSGYVGQSVVALLIFYGFGLGWFGRTPPTVAVALTVLLFTGQVLLCNLWLRRFRFGPLEWLWRSLTYARPQPMRVMSVEAKEAAA
jgi:uncharacterized protein